MSDNESNVYGEGDTTFQAVGGKEGLHALVTDFFHFMGSEPQFKRLFDMHPCDTALSIDKLYRFLTGWMGSDKLYSQKYGSIQLPRAHMHLDVIEDDKHAPQLIASWLPTQTPPACQDYSHRHSRLQPSPSSRLPSSQCSSQPTRPSPHRHARMKLFSTNAPGPVSPVTEFTEEEPVAGMHMRPARTALEESETRISPPAQSALTAQGLVFSGSRAQ